MLVPTAVFYNALNVELPSFAFTRWQMQYMETEHAKQDLVLKARFYFNYLTCYSGTNTQGSQEFIPHVSFIIRWFDIVQILNDCTCTCIT